MTTTSAAVATFYRVVRHDSYTIYHCKSCGWGYAAPRDSTRDQRMLTLARHLADQHQSGPLAVPV